MDKAIPQAYGRANTKPHAGEEQQGGQAGAEWEKGKQEDMNNNVGERGVPVSQWFSTWGDVAP